MIGFISWLKKLRNMSFYVKHYLNNELEALHNINIEYQLKCAIQIHYWNKIQNLHYQTYFIIL